MVTDVAVASQHLERVVGDLEHLVGGVLSREDGLARGRQPLVQPPGGFPREQANGVDLDRHVGEHERDRLLLRDRHAERLALLGVLARVVERGPRHAHGRPGASDTPGGEQRLGWGSGCGSGAAAPRGAGAGTRTPSSVTGKVSRAFSPMFFSRSPTPSPLAPRSTRKAARPSATEAYTRTTSARSASGTKHFSPVSTQSPPLRSARVAGFEASKSQRASTTPPVPAVNAPPLNLRS